MLKAYLDRGAKPGGGRVMCMAGALFWPFHYERFLHEWQPFLDGWSADAFHSTDIYNGVKPFDWKRPDGTVDLERRAQHLRDSRRIPELIAPHVRKLLVVTFNEDEFEAVAPEAWRRRFGNVHRVAAQMMAQSIGFWAQRSDHEGDIAYFYETGDGDDEHVHNGLLGVYRKEKQRTHARMASTPIGVDKGKARGLEVADFVAWQWNKFAVDTLASSRPRPFRKDSQKLMNLLEARGEEVDIRKFTGKALVDFLLDQGCTLKRRETAV